MKVMMKIFWEILLGFIIVFFFSSCSSLELNYQLRKAVNTESKWIETKYESWNHTYFEYQNDNLNIKVYDYLGGKQLTFGFEYLPIFPSFWDRIIFKQDRVEIHLEINKTIENLNEFLTIKLNGKTISYRTEFIQAREDTLNYSLTFYTDLDYINQMEIIFDGNQISKDRIKIPNLLLDKTNYIGYREFFAS